MRVDKNIAWGSIDIGGQARQAEQRGYRGVWVSEITTDPFLPLALAAEHTTEIDLATGIVVAFARNPMTTAVAANDLQRFSRGRFLLGLGPQVRPHITNRFSMPWSHPAPRMREFILALRAIWACWNDGTKLDFRGEFYTHNLMTPFFSPPPNPYGAPRVLLAGVGEHMTEVAGEVADGFLAHGFTTERYLREVTLPRLARGRAKAGKTLDGFEIKGLPFVVTGRNEAELAESARVVKEQIAFYGSTPAYRPVLALHGWSGVYRELNLMSRDGRWAEMADLIDDTILETFAVVAPPDRVAAELRQRYGDIFTRLAVYAKADLDDDIWQPMIEELHGGTP